MSVIDERVNEGWSPDGESYTHDGDNQSMDQTQDFLNELVSDDDARDRVRDAADSYVQGQINDGLPADVEGAGTDDRDHRLNELGRVFGVVTDADVGAMTDEFEEAESDAELKGRVVDYVLSRTPAGRYNDVAALVEVNAGAWTKDLFADDPERFQENVRELLLDARDQIEGQDLPSDDIAQMRRGPDDAAKHSS